MGIFFCVAVFVMHPVHYRIRSWHKIGRALREKGHKIKNPFPSFCGGIHLMRSIAVQKK